MSFQAARCPDCSNKLFKVVQSPKSPLSPDQFDAVKAGDWYCTNCKGTRSYNGYKYFWERDLAELKPSPRDIALYRAIAAPIGRVRTKILDHPDIPYELREELDGDLLNEIVKARDLVKKVLSYE